MHPMIRPRVLRACLLLALGLATPLMASCDEDQTGQGGDNAQADADNNPQADLGQDSSPAPDLDQDSGGDPDMAMDASPDAPQGDCVQDSDCDDGLYCNGTERCFGGQCLVIAAQPCEDLNDCTTSTCNEETDRCDFDVDDTRCPPGQVCDPKAGCFQPSECSQDSDCDDGLFCNGAETCDTANGACRPGEPPQCDDDIACTEDTCIEELGGCENQPNHMLCLPDELCSTTEGCTQRPPCASDDDCDDALFCNGTETCDTDTGLCISGDAPTRSDGLDCTVDACSNQLASVTHTPNPARCSDGAFCNGAEVCHPVNGCVAGEPPVLSDAVSCTMDSCNEEDDFIEHSPDASACDDGLFCNGAEVCHPVDGCRPGEPPLLNDGIGCTIDACDEITGEVRHMPDDSLCDDGLFCNGAETCDPTQGCVRGPAPEVDDGVGCTVDACDEQRDQVTHSPDHGLCDNGLFCDGAETCDVAQGCQEGEAPEVDDNIDCTQDACDEENDVVTHAPNHGACDDGLFCNGAEVCDVERGCATGPTPGVDDGVGCTMDACDEDSDTITHTPQDTACDDALFCNGAETCHPTLGCQAGAAPVLEDGVDCTRGSCDEANDRVLQVPDSALCDNGLFCDGAETCDMALGCQSGAAPQVDDGVACTVDSCDEANDRVLHAPNNALCDNGLFCDGAETCHPTLDCQGGAAPQVDDGVACTVDACDEGSDTITHTPNHGLCDNGEFCDGDEQCNPTLGCQDAPDRADGVLCGQDPRQICLESACQESQCGDGFLDEGNDEACDDGDQDDNNACNNSCMVNQGDVVDPTGTYGFLPDQSYYCDLQGFIILLDYQFTGVSITANGNQLTATMIGDAQDPSGPFTLTLQGTLEMDNSFELSGVRSGSCTETYTLSGAFSPDNEDLWTGTFARTLSGTCFGCVSGSSVVRGTRQ